MKRATIYERKGYLFVHTSSRSEQGVWVLDGACERIPAASADETIGAVILSALENSRTVPHPMAWSNLFAPVLMASGTRNWRAFVLHTKCVEAEMDGGRVAFVPTRNEGSDEGFVPILDSVQILLEVTAGTVGHGARQALLRSD